jgi:thiol-disulfide isomerase/thioredoxin
VSVKAIRPSLLSRRSIIATATGLAAAVGLGKFSRAQSADSDLPDVATVITRMSPTAAPAFVFFTPAAKRLTLADFAGHTLVVNLWATWCPPCRDELPTFAALAPKLKASGILVLPISIDSNGATAVRPYFKTQDIRTLPILLDENGDNLDALNTDGIPVTVVINPEGKMVARLDGAADWNTPATIAYLQSLGKSRAIPDGFVPV